MVANEKTKTGLFKLGFVANSRNDAFLKELHHAIEGTEVELPSFQEIRRIADVAEIIYLNFSGYPQDREGNPVSELTAQYLTFNTGYKNLDG